MKIIVKYARRVVHLLMIMLVCVISISAQSYVASDDFNNSYKAEKDSFILSSPYLNMGNIDNEKIVEIISRQPSFALYKDNYFVTGVPLNKKTTRFSADAKFQISVRQRLMKNIMSKNSIIFLTYTQKSFWTIYQESAPFSDVNYNPGVALGSPILLKGRLKGFALLSVEHESNGKDTIESRSWNFTALSCSYFFNPYITIQSKLWIGLLGNENKDLFDYRGYGLLAVNYRSINDRWGYSLILNPCKRYLNTNIEVSFKTSVKSNQYLFLQFYNGYGDSLLDYDQFSSMVRVGICLKPFMRDIF